MLTLDTIRVRGEADLRGLLADLDAANRRKLLAALELYGSVRAIPESVWDEIKRDMEMQLASALLLIVAASDEWTVDSIERQGVRPAADQNLAGYALTAAGAATLAAEQTTETLRSRLERRIQDATIAPGLGGVGRLTRDGIEQALDDVLTDVRRATIATDQTTAAISKGQLGGRGRMGGENEFGQSVEIQMLWRTERDGLVCPRCSPLEGKPEEVWSLIFPNGPGQEAHPNCRCFLDMRVIVEPAARSVA